MSGFKKPAKAKAYSTYVKLLLHQLVMWSATLKLFITGMSEKQ